MRFICLGFANEALFESLSESEMNAWMERCFEYDDELRRCGHFVGGEALQNAKEAITLRFQDGKVLTTAGPYAETREFLGGILMLEAKDLNHAIQLMTNHPGIRAGAWEIRPADEHVNELVRQRAWRLKLNGPCEHPQAGDEHRWLQQMVGHWTFEHTCSMPGQEPMKSKGSETVRPLGGLWVMGESEVLMPDGSPGRMVITLGFDPQKQRFVGTFVASMMSMMWQYEGVLDESKRVLALDTMGPNFGGEGMAAYQDIIELVDADTRVLRSQKRLEDGSWQHVMEGRYRRVG